MKRFFRRCRLEWRSLVRSTWLAPLLCLLLCGACAHILPESWGVERLAPGTWEYACLLLLSMVVVLTFLLLLCCVAGGLRRPQGRGERVRRLLWATAAGVPCLVWALWMPYSLVCATEAHAADDWRVPAGVPFEVPAMFTLTGDKVPEAVRSLVRAQSATEIISWPSPEGEPPNRAEHAEALAQQHPDLLRELWLRSLMLGNKNSITAKSMDVPHSWKDCTVLLHPEGMPAGYVLAAPQCGEISTTALAVEEGRVAGDVQAYPVSASEKLGGGWQLSYLTKEGFSLCRHEGLEALARYRLDFMLRELADDPTLATLDRLLPVTPCPGLRLRQTSLGYDLTLCLPKEARTDGRYTIRAVEYESGTPLQLDPRARTIRPADMTALAAHRLLFFDSFVVRTGRRGQYYGSRWQIVFIPDEGPEDVLCEQLFLMTGRWR